MNRIETFLYKHILTLFHDYAYYHDYNFVELILIILTRLEKKNLINKKNKYIIRFINLLLLIDLYHLIIVNEY
jgi:hypothetical protein